ncbi:MAG TPA: hypothetical protein VGS97_06625 [Actinocrinis sp.]|uniref:hypothetical protein n=1 Tax=Actinocrinis sp. TaxID=1920516 RepID=UPI002DDDB80D|nr:hypothetical protein [Actinocrinis sp.]HEV2343746.1 hypothetical protein [Actinocrinis sp.]
MRSVRTLALAGAAILALSVSMGPAMADPPANTTVATTDVVTVGSDTTQYVHDQLSLDWNGQTPAPANKYYSWDAVNPTTGLPGDKIQTKGTSTADPNCNITRPNGSGAGIAQVEAKLKTHDGNYCVDDARASRQLKAADGADLLAVDEAKDLITVSVTSGGDGTQSGIAVSDTPVNELKAIYDCNAAEINSGFSGNVTWAEIGSTGAGKNNQIIPVLPQANSGTRATFLSDIGVTWSTPPSCVVNGTNGSGGIIEENEGTNAEFGPDTLFPYSAGVYVCQTITKKCPDIHGSQVLLNIDGKAPIVNNVINVSGLNAFPAKYIRDLYIVSLNGFKQTPQTCTDPSDYGFVNTCIPNYLKAHLGGGTPGPKAAVCGTMAAADYASFGFKISPTCGAVISNSN